MGSKARELAKLILCEEFLQEEDLQALSLTEIGRYELLSLLGEGATGQVFLARDRLMSRKVAIKLVKEGSSLPRLQQELETLARLEHPGVTSLFDAGVHQGRPFLVMAYAGDKTLAGAELDLREWVEVLLAVLEACDYVHEAGVVHRDLKPANVILGERPSIADFGIVKLLGEGVQLTAKGCVVGTPAYMAPEQLRGGEIGPWTDIYSAGAMLYERITGRVPYEGENLLALAAQIAAEEPVLDALQVNPSAPRALARVAARALQKSSQARYPTAGAMAQDLRAWLDRGRPARPQLVRTQLVLVGLSLCVVLALALGYLASDSANPEASEPDPIAEASAVLAAAPLAAPTTAPLAAPTTAPLAAPTTAPLAAKSPSRSPTPRPRPSRPLSPARKTGASTSPSETFSHSRLSLLLEEADARLSSSPSASEAQAYARLCWRILWRSMDEAWPHPVQIPILITRSEREIHTPEESLVVANAALLRLWLEREVDESVGASPYERCRLSIRRSKEAQAWEAEATVAVALLLLKRSAKRRLVARGATARFEACLKRLSELAPGGEPELVSELRRRMK